MQPPYQPNQYSGYQQPPPNPYGPPPPQPNQYSQPPPNQYGQNPQYPPPPANQYSQGQYNQQRPPYAQQPPYGGQPQQPPYGGQQQQPPYGGQQKQPPYGGQQQQPPYGGQPNNQTDIPNFRLIGRGNGIDEREYYVITHAAADALNKKEDPLSNGIIKRIKRDIGGEWMVFASIESLKGYDFSLSIVTGNDFLSFTIQNFRFQVCRLRD